MVYLAGGLFEHCILFFLKWSLNLIKTRFEDKIAKLTDYKPYILPGFETPNSAENAVKRVFPFSDIFSNILQHFAAFWFKSKFAPFDYFRRIVNLFGFNFFGRGNQRENNDQDEWNEVGANVERGHSVGVQRSKSDQANGQPNNFKDQVPFSLWPEIQGYKYLNIGQAYLSLFFWIQK